jgi:hypothetical protein
MNGLPNGYFSTLGPCAQRTLHKYECPESFSAKCTVFKHQNLRLSSLTSIYISATANELPLP